MKNQDYQEVYRFRAVYQPSSAEEGTVIDQRPAQGSVIQEGDTIELIISQGNVMPEMPDILGFTLEDAAREDEIITILMGDKVDPRREYIISHAEFNKQDNFESHQLEKEQKN